MAYVLGFLFADGNVVRTSRGSYYIAFYSSDKELLLRMRSEMGSEHKISKRNARSGNVYRIQIGSKKLFDDLFRLGLTPGKARRMKFPHIPSQFMRDFIRGYFDGDGNIWTGVTHRHRNKVTPGLQVSFTSGSQSFLAGLLQQLRALGIRGGSLFVIKKKNASRLTLSVNDALKLCSLMYNAPCKLYLVRKRTVFEQFVNERA